MSSSWSVPHLVSHATFAGVQYMPNVLPDELLWQSGSAGSWQSLLAVHGVVHAANTLAGFAQLKHIV
ncbi:MAG TPA: hypothetical protein VIQ54_26590, partial [Polyangia bacterium]